MVRRGCCAALHLNEDNARFCLLAALILLYLLCGAAVFSAIEHPSEIRARHLWRERLHNFTQAHNVSVPMLHDLLRHYEEANVAGIRVDSLRPRWDFPGAFYFVGTVVSTIGFGMTTPVTIGGKVFLIFYGLIGCAATILFFNLFLERIITLLAYIMRWYYVMLILGVAAVLIACSASALYSVTEDWGYFESLYFCFVAFSTIGFGDLVSGQKEHYENQAAYRLGNCLFILMGVCCIYSLFNVISIVIKQTLNWILKKVDCGRCRRQRCCCCCCLPRKRPRHLHQPPPSTHNHRHHHHSRNAVQPAPPATKGRRADVSVETVCDSETDGRRLSGEMISVKDFLASNKVSLAIMQKQLSETAHGGPRQSHARHNGFSAGVGALAIMNNRLAETSVDR
ncbi:KCNKD protein, partial [Amia calva]|nr:KCNKD protein [Amia calva]